MNNDINDLIIKWGDFINAFNKIGANKINQVRVEMENKLNVLDSNTKEFEEAEMNSMSLYCILEQMGENH